MAAEPILKINCVECKLRTEHALSKNVKGEIVYMCLRCGRDIDFSSAMNPETGLKDDLPVDDSIPIGVA
jgi:hypothetical protein